MSELLKKAFEKPRALTQNKHHFLVNRSRWPSYIHNFYPLAQEYFHEFNPYFVQLLDKEHFQEFNVFTVRDGVFAFSDFILKNVKTIPEWNCLFLIPPHYTPLVPESIRSHFLSYSLTQKIKPDIKKAKTVTIFSLLCNQYYKDLEKVEDKLTILSDLPSEVSIDVCLPQRRNPFDPDDKETLDFIHLPELIRKTIGNRKFRWIKTRDLLERTIYSDDYLLDLMEGSTLTCDSYLHYWFLSRGGMVSSVSNWDGKEKPFDLDLSFHHKLHVEPLPEIKSNIIELVFLSKMAKGDVIYHPLFHTEVMKAIRT